MGNNRTRHGGKDPGAFYQDIYEKDLTLSISKKLYKLLKEQKVNVYLTRTGDYDLSSPGAYYRKKSDFDNRIKFIKNINPDLYISIHINYLTDFNYYGIQAFYENNNFKNQILAETLQKTFNKYLDSQRKIKTIPNNTYMYHKINTPGVLIECGFLSNSYERNLLIDDNYQLKLSKTIVKGLEVYFKNL